jgi:alpha-galactosidase
VERLKIQYGTSLVYPIISMGSHVSAVPNHQVHRQTSLETRGNVAMSGNLGYELDVTKISEEEKLAVKNQVDFYKKIRNTVQFGDFYRLKSPFETNETAWMFISEDGEEVVVYYFRVLAEANVDYKPLRLKGLEESSDYQLTGEDRVFGGDELMYVGLNIPNLQGDFQSYIWTFKKIQ